MKIYSYFLQPYKKLIKNLLYYPLKTIVYYTCLIFNQFVMSRGFSSFLVYLFYLFTELSTGFVDKFYNSLS